MVKTDLFNGYMVCSTCPAGYSLCDRINQSKSLVYVLHCVIVFNVLRSQILRFSFWVLILLFSHP